MGCLFRFAIAEAGKVLLDDDSFGEGNLEPFGVARHLGAGVIGHVEVFGASVATSL